jgi:hypothetical protein
MSDMPAVATYRGCELHAFQSEARIRETVCPQIDRVLDAMDEPSELFAFAGDPAHAPEARLAAARRLLEWAIGAETGRRRMTFSREQIDAATAGLGALRWADPEQYCTLLDSDRTKAAPRPEPFKSALAAMADA